MQKTQLGTSGLDVSAWSLGTMTFGNQTPPDQGMAQMDRALDAGVTFWDCAEMYPVNPVRAETVGNSERVLGDWVASRGGRDRVQIATKVSGPNGGFVRDGAGYDGATIREAVEASLDRLRTDYIDLYQLHWPNRGSYHFRQNWAFDPRGQSKSETLAHMHDVMIAMKDLVAQGKVRAFGLSNDTAWGTTRWIDVAQEVGGPRVASVQNEYSLLCRLYDTDMAEMATNEAVTLYAYSPLAAGMLTGKYQGGAVPDGSRMAVSVANGDGNQLGGRNTDLVGQAVDAYAQIARDHGVDPVHMALAFCTQRPFHCIPIFGATTVAQLDHILAGTDTVLSDEALAAIEAAHKAHPMPF